MSIADGIARWLGANVVGVDYSFDSSGNVFVNWTPATPAEAVMVYVTPGFESDSRLPYDEIQFQVISRGEHGSPWAYDTMDLIRAALHGLRNVVLPDGTHLAYCLAVQGSPFRMGDDDNGRPSVSVDFRGEVIVNDNQERQ